MSDKEKQLARVKSQRFSGGQYVQRGVLGVLDINGRVVKGHYIAKLLQYPNVTPGSRILATRPDAWSTQHHNTKKGERGGREERVRGWWGGEDREDSD